jgi:RimJ/RimL family protein N-acetyltransferase
MSASEALMLHELPEAAYQTVVPLFEAAPPAYAQLVIRSVVAGNAPGRVWVDDAGQPRSVLVWDKGQCFDLAGTADNGAFNAAAAELIHTQIAPDLAARGLTLIKVRYATPEWEPVIPDLFPATLTRRERRLYTFAAAHLPDWAERVPPGCALVPIDEALLARADLQNRERVWEEIACCWTARFFEQGLGIAALHDTAIVGWCTGEYASGQQIGIGIETITTYQGRGLATLMAAAFVAHCQARDLVPYWDCWASNAPSRAVAEKAGFVLAREYPAFFGPLQGGDGD